MTTESATEPANLEQLCALQEGLLQRSLRVLLDVHEEYGFAGDGRYQVLLDDLIAHVDPDGPPPADVRLLAQANTVLLDQLNDLKAFMNFADWYGPVVLEVAAARRKFPSSDLLTLALAEESGEVVQAMLNLRAGKPGAGWAHVEQECIQTMAMCVRLMQEGDPAVWRI